MTTMDSDSESQDSDEGRRFRFETTRKDSNTSLNSRKRKSSPSHREQTSRRSRSRDRTNNHREQQQQHRRDIDRSRHDYRKKETTTPAPRGRSRHERDFSKASNHRDATYRATSPKLPRRESRNNDKRRSSRERSHDEKITNDPKRNKSRDSKRYSREHSRERSSQSFRARVLDVTRGRGGEENSKIDCTRKQSRKNDVKTTRNNVATPKEVVKVENLIDRDSRPLQDCKDMNLSDFDIVSDTEEMSSDNSPSSGIFQSTELDENSQLTENDMSMKRRVSKQHYERLLKREAVKKRRSDEELRKVKTENGDNEKINNNAVSDFLLGCDVAKMAVATSSTKNIVNQELVDVDEENNADISPDNSKICHDNITEMNYEDSASDDSTYGPALPPLCPNEKMASQGRVDENFVDSLGAKKIEKTLRIIGPNLPEDFCAIEATDDDEIEDTFGPALPPHLTLTSNLSENEKNEVPSGSEDEDFMGPLPVDHPSLENDVVQQQLERRARRLKAELAACDNEDEKKREEWMIELPPVKSANLGLGPRKFRVRPAPDMSDRSSWTDTPADRARKRMEKLENKNVPEPTISADREPGDAIIEREKLKKREKSLLEIHQKKLHKKKKKEEREAKKIGKTAERRPFDRDVDLQANRFDEARKKSMLLKARALDDRFSRGKI